MAYSGDQQVFSPYAAMGNSPAMVIAEIVMDVKALSYDGYVNHGGLDVVTIHQFMANSAHTIFGKILMLGKFRENRRT